MAPFLSSRLPVCCALLLGLCCMILPTSLAAQQSAAMVPYATSDAGVVVGFDVKNARHSALFKHAMKMAGQNRKFQRAATELEAKAGVSLERDVHALLFLAPAPRGAGAAKNTPFTLVLQGDFDAQKIAMALTKDEVKELAKGKHFLLQEDSELWLATKDKMVLVHGPQAYRKKAIAQAKSAKKTGLGGAMQKQIAQLDTTKHLWMALDASGIKGGAQGEISSLRLQGDLSSGVALEGNMVFKSAEDAKKLVENFQQNRTKVTMGTAMIGAPSLGSSLQLRHSGKALEFSTKVPESEVVASLNWVENYEKSQRARAKMRQEEEEEKKAKQGAAPAAK